VRSIRRHVARLYRGVSAKQIAVERGPGWTSYRGNNTVLVSGARLDPRRGILLRGACDVPALFTLAPLLVDRLEGSICIRLDGSGVSAARSDQLLQAHDGVPDEFVRRVASRLDLAHDYFAPTLFAPTFTPPGFEEHGSFPKSVVVLSVLPDLSRTIYRHRETGYIVDPGTAWLNNKLASALSDLSFIEWFRSEFESAGRMSIEDFKRSYRRLVPLIRSETGAHVLVLNTLDIDPLDTRYEYSQLNITRAVRRRQLNIALDELARELDFRVLDVDRVLKEEGVDRQVDFSHFPVERMRAVAAEAHRILVDLGVV
jgi:hypothetical protein